MEAIKLKVTCVLSEPVAIYLQVTLVRDSRVARYPWFSHCLVNVNVASMIVYILKLDENTHNRVQI